MTTPFDSIENAVRDIKKGKFVILVDDEDRENEGDLVIAAEKVTPQSINFMATHARGLICLALTPERVEELQLPQQAVENTATFGTAFTVSIDARKDITTGISAADRATTIHVAIDPKINRPLFSWSLIQVSAIQIGPHDVTARFLIGVDTTEQFNPSLELQIEFSGGRDPHEADAFIGIESARRDLELAAQR